MKDNDGRKPVGWLPELRLQNSESAVVEVIEEATGETLYSVRTEGASFVPPVYAFGNYTIKVGKDRAEKIVVEHFEAAKSLPEKSISVSVE
jgi:hypothetical protein